MELCAYLSLEDKGAEGVRDGNTGVKGQAGSFLVMPRFPEPPCVGCVPSGK